jgi:hypothetical protein
VFFPIEHPRSATSEERREMTTRHATQAPFQHPYPTGSVIEALGDFLNLGPSEDERWNELGKAAVQQIATRTGHKSLAEIDPLLGVCSDLLVAGLAREFRREAKRFKNQGPGRPATDSMLSASVFFLYLDEKHGTPDASDNALFLRISTLLGPGLSKKSVSRAYKRGLSEISSTLQGSVESKLAVLAKKQVWDEFWERHKASPKYKKDRSLSGRRLH